MTETTRTQLAKKLLPKEFIENNSLMSELLEEEAE